ncbi:MAG: hypothetical protein J6D42_03360 [Clostridia bacterium]|nr:hypothetical protein [Clostridia bacterium]
MPPELHTLPLALSFFEAAILFLIVVAIITAIICFIVFPLLRYIVVRIFLFIRCIFCNAKFAKVGLPGFLIPHFWNHKPDFMLLSGNKLYIIKLKSYRKTKATVMFTSPSTWHVSDHRGLAPTENEGIIDQLTMAFHKFTVNKRKKKSPVGLVKYAASINYALKDSPIDCVPVVMFNPSLKEVRTVSNIDLIDGDTIHYGIVIANHFFPSKPEKCAVSGKEARKIFRTARRAMRKKHYVEMKKGF